MPAGKAFSIKSQNFAHSISSQFSLFIPLKAENLWSFVFRGWGIVVVVERGRGGGGGERGEGVGQKVSISLKWINLMSLGFIYEILFIELIYGNYFWDEQVLNKLIFALFPHFSFDFLSSFCRWVSLSKCIYCKNHYYYYRTIEMSF